MCLSFVVTLIFIFIFFHVSEKTGQNLFVVVLRLSPSAIKGQCLRNWEPSEKEI